MAFISSDKKEFRVCYLTQGEQRVSERQVVLGASAAPSADVVFLFCKRFVSRDDMRNWTQETELLSHAFCRGVRGRLLRPDGDEELTCNCKL